MSDFPKNADVWNFAEFECEFFKKDCRPITLQIITTVLVFKDGFPRSRSWPFGH